MRYGKTLKTLYRLKANEPSGEVHNKGGLTLRSFEPCTTVRLVTVIESGLLMRGNGHEGSPLRRITQYYSLDGELLAERDPVYGDAALSLVAARKLATALRRCKERLEELKLHASGADRDWLLKEAQSSETMEVIMEAEKALHAAYIESHCALC